jgi:hypothetical protein
VWQLDGGRAFVALTRAHRAVAAAALVAGWLVAHDGLVLVLALVAAARVFERGAPREADRPVLAWFVGAALALAALAALSAGTAPGAS